MGSDLYTGFSNYAEINEANRHHAANKELDFWGTQKEQYQKYREEWNKAANESYTPKNPLNVDIELSDACNLKCKMCAHGIGAVKNVGFMSKELAFQLIDECASLKVAAIKFNWRGEATLAKFIPECIKYAKTKGILEVSINTNGLPPANNPQVTIACAEAGIDRIIFSVDGFSAETYLAVRTGSNYEKVIANIHALLNWKKEHNSLKPFVRVQMVRTKLNAHEVQDYINYWQPLVNDVRISDVMDRGQGNKLAVGDQITDGRRRCPQPFQRLTIGRDGRVSPCCADWNQEYIIGDVHSSSLSAIWNSEKMLKMRKIQNNIDLDKINICQNCYVKESYLWKKIDLNQTTP